MIINQTTTLIFEYPQDYLQEQEWCKTKEDRWIHKGTDTLGAVYENQISYSIGATSDRKTEPTISKMEQVDEPQYDFGEYADRLWKIAYERGKREALEQTEPSCDTCKLKDTTEWCKRQEVCRAYQPKDEPLDKDINVRSKDEQTDCTEALTLLWIKHMVTDEEFYRIDARLKCISCKWWNDTIVGGSECVSKECTYQPKDEPQTDCAWK